MGVELSNNLKWEKHINNIVSKASRLLGMLARVLRTADTKTRKVAYETLIRPGLEYGCQVWDPYLKSDINKLEKLQNRALRFIFRLRGQVSFTKLREGTGILSLKERRKELRKKLFYKVKSTGVIKDPFNTLRDHTHNTRQPLGLQLPSIKTNALYNSFWPRTTRDIRDATIGHS